MTLLALARFSNWREVPKIVKLETFNRWHRTAFFGGDRGQLPEVKAEPAGDGPTGRQTAGAELECRRSVPSAGRVGCASARLSEGCYLLSTNVTDWTGEELWRANIQLTEVSVARIQSAPGNAAL